MRKLNHEEVLKLGDCKGIKGGPEKFFDILAEIYADDEEAMKEVNEKRAMMESVDDIESWPAYEKTKHMFYGFMDDLLDKIGYTAK